MSLGKVRGHHSIDRQRRLNRAQWWFNRMRQVVESAREYSPAPATQTASTAAQIALVIPGVSRGEQQLCE
ncbi:MAG TPA: hypothetical protein VNZ22_01990 [Bacillota bacterium]|nr:hypothetical protein [Bacillota bacterium]